MDLLSKNKINKILNYKFIILIFISFLLSNYSTFNYLKKYDNYSAYKARRRVAIAARHDK